MTSYKTCAVPMCRSTTIKYPDDKIVFTSNLIHLIDPAPMLYRVQLAVGARCYQGEGATPQAARHDAAAKALAELKLTQPEEGRPAEAVVAEDVAPVLVGDDDGEESDADLLNLDVKSPVSLVHELALKLNLTHGVKFAKGPPHMKLIDPAPMLYRVQLAVGARCYQGEGATPQAARHDAAAKALAELKLAQPEEGRPAAEAVVAEDVAPVLVGDDDGEESDADLLNLDVKSPVSLVHELALKLNLTVALGVKFAKGPPHMKLIDPAPMLYRVELVVGARCYHGEGATPQAARHDAAAKALAELKLAQPEEGRPAAEAVVAEDVAPVLVGDDDGEDSAKLAELKLAQPEEGRPAAEAVVAEDVAPVLVGDDDGEDSAKLAELKLAQPDEGRPAAEAVVAEDVAPVLVGDDDGEDVLTALGINTASACAETERATSPKLADGTKPRKVTFSEANASEGSSDGSAGRQLVPGLLLMQENYSSSQQFNTTKSGTVTTQARAATVLPGAVASPAKGPGGGQVGWPKEQLMYLARLLGFQVQFNDLPKDNSHGEFLSLVSLSTDPPLTCHGGGASTEKSHAQAARAALQMIAHMGLDNVVAQAHGDGIHVVSGNVRAKPSLLSNGVKQ